MFRRWRALARLDADIRDHLEREIQDNVDRGMTPEEARRRALIALATCRWRWRTRAVWRWRLADELSQDVRYAPRTFRRQPGFAVVVVPTLALGIANTAIFSLFEAIMLRGWLCTSRSSSTSSRTVPGASLHPRTIRTTSACAPGPTCLPASLATRGHVQSGRGRWRRNDARTVRQRQLSRGSRCADGDRARVHRRERP